MKKLIILIIFIFSMFNFANAQILPELEEVKEIKLLESDQDEVRKIFASYNLNSVSDLGYFEWFSTNNANIKVYYSRETCSDTHTEIWNLPSWKATQIAISLLTPITLENFEINLSEYERKGHQNIPHLYVKYEEDLGTALLINKDKVEEIIFFPSKRQNRSLCFMRYVTISSTSRGWSYDWRRGRLIVDESNGMPDVTGLNIDATEIASICACKNSEQNKNCSKINIAAISEDPDGDMLVYKYKVSGGEIIGEGAKILWDLSGMRPGTYTITAAVDDGCGFCGKTMTKTVVVKEYSNCSKN